MKLSLDSRAKKKFRGILLQLILDLIDGDVDFPDQTAHTLEELASEIRRQNTSAMNEAAKNPLV